jgi:hypothetical protein
MYAGLRAALDGELISAELVAAAARGDKRSELGRRRRPWWCCVKEDEEEAEQDCADRVCIADPRMKLDGFLVRMIGWHLVRMLG